MGQLQVPEETRRDGKGGHIARCTRGVDEHNVSADLREKRGWKLLFLKVRM